VNPSPTNPVAPAYSRKYRAFISYNQAADGRLAPAVQTGLQNFSKPWYRRRALRIFRDQTGLSVTPELWGSIERALQESDFLILLASPAAAASKWVEQEVDWWLDHRSARQLLIVLTEGDLFWDQAAGDYDWRRTTALPRRLVKAFPEEPLFLDLRWAKSANDTSLRRPKFADAIARLAATLHGKSLDELIGEDIRQHTTTLRLFRMGVGVLLVLTTLAVVTAVIALQARTTAGRLDQAGITAAEKQARQTQSERLAATALNQVADPNRRILLAAEAFRIHPTDAAENALRRTLAGPLESVLELQLPGSSQNYGVFHPGGLNLLLWNETQARLCETSGTVLQELKLPATEIFQATFSGSGRHLATVSKDGVTRIWNGRTGELVLEVPPDEPATALLNSDGSRLLTLNVNTEAILWNVLTGAKLGTLRFLEIPFFSDQVPVAAFSPIGNRVALCTPSGPVIVDTDTGKIVLTLTGHAQSPRSVSYSPDGHWLITAGNDRTLRKWRTLNGQLAITVSHDSELRDAQFSPDGRWMAAWDSDRQLLIWNAETGQRTARVAIRQPDGPPLCFTFSPNGRCVLVAAYDDGPAELIDPQSGDRLASLSDSEGERRTLHFSPDGHQILVGNLGAPARIFPGDLAGSSEELLALAQRRVPRGLTDAERAQYGLTPRIH